VKHAQWYHDNEEGAIDVQVKYGTKIKLAKGGTLKVAILQRSQQ
jgi:hypothetical protein